MASEVFQLTIVTRIFGEQAGLAEAPGFPEISALDDSESRWLKTIQQKSKAILEDPEYSPALSLYRRRLVTLVRADEVELAFDPPPQGNEWTVPVAVRVPFVWWTEEGELYQAFVPALGIYVFAPREDLILERVREHTSLVLLGRNKSVSLAAIERLTRFRSIHLNTIEVTADLKSPKQLAQAPGSQAATEKSMLEKLAEELPPSVSILSAGSAAAKTAAAAALVPIAFEMETEMAAVAELLSAAYPRSLLLVGPSGCGKTALVRELARRRREFGLTHTPFWTTSGARLMTGPIGYGMWQERCQQLCREAARTRSILHLGNLGELLEVGKTRTGEPSVGSFLRPWIARGDILAIAECTPEQIGVIEKLEPHLLSAFQQTPIAERTPEQVRRILEMVHSVHPGEPEPGAQRAVTRRGLDRLHQLHLRYAPYSAMPARPVRFLKNLLADRAPKKSFSDAEVTAAFSRETGLPVLLLEDHVPLDLGSTGEWFGRRVIGQEEAVGQVLDILALIKARLARPRKPLASLLFIGPTGTGKTELTKALAEFLFGDAARLVRFDLNEFSDPAAVQRLIGGSTGVEGLLTARIREQPFSVVLLDEFEKADASFFDLLLQILGDGRLTDAAGRVADFSNSVIVMTSNLGSQSFQRGPAGFRADNSITPEATEHFSDAVRSFLRPEIYNRFDAIVPFRPLTRQQVLQIAQRQLEMLKLRDGLRVRQIDLEIEAGVAERLVQVGFNPRYGARPLKRAVEREVLTPLSEALVSYFDDVPLRATVSVFQNRIRVEARAKTEKRLESSPAGPPELVLSVCQERRRIGRLKQSSAASALENQMTMIAALERRLKSASWKSSEQTAALAKLPSLRSCLEALQSLSARAGQVETELLVSFYARENLDRILFESERTSLFQERRRLTCEVLRLSQDNPGHIVVALYSEDREWLIELTRAYFGLANQLGKVLRLDCFVPPKTGRSIGTGAVRETPKAIDKWFESPPEKLIGLVMEWKGDLFAPRFASEAGLHTMRRGKKPLTVLVETSGGAFEQYAAPAGIDRPGTIENKGAPVQRVYLAERQQVDDRVLGEVPWPSLSVQNGLGTLIEGRLEKVLENLIA